MHLPSLGQCAARNLFLLILHASFNLWFDHFKNGAKEKKQHEMDGLQGQGLFAQEDIQWLKMTESMEEEPTSWSSINSGERNLGTKLKKQRQ